MTEHRFSELDDLVLNLKGLVLVRELLERRHATLGEIATHNAEIERVGEQLARTVREAGAAYRVAA